MLDLRFFMENERVKTISIIKNNGCAEMLTKTASFDIVAMKTSIARAVKKYVKLGVDAEYNKVVEAALNKLNGGGIEWLKK